MWTCLLFIRSDQNHLARHNETGKKTRQTEEEVGTQHQGMDRPGVNQVLQGSGEQRKTEETVREVICGAQISPTVKGWVKVKSHLQTQSKHKHTSPNRSEESYTP